MDRYLSVTPVDHLLWQMTVRFYSMWYLIQSELCMLARKVGWLWICILSQVSSYQSCFSNVVLSLFYVSWTSNNQNIFPIGALSWTSWEAYSTLQLHQSCCCFSHYEHVSCSYTLGAFHANDVNFFFINLWPNKVLKIFLQLYFNPK